MGCNCEAYFIFFYYLLLRIKKEEKVGQCLQQGLLLASIRRTISCIVVPLALIKCKQCIQAWTWDVTGCFSCFHSWELGKSLFLKYLLGAVENVLEMWSEITARYCSDIYMTSFAERLTLSLPQLAWRCRISFWNAERCLSASVVWYTTDCHSGFRVCNSPQLHSNSLSSCPQPP